MKKIRTLIVDDEPLAREGLVSLMESDPEIELIGSCADGQSALETIRTRKPDLVFLDVQMPKRDGISVLAELKPAERPVVIFATAYDQHAIQAFEYCAIDYLLKPFSNARFAHALARAKTEIRKSRTSQLSQQVEQLLEHVRELDAPAGAAVPSPPAPAAPDYVDRIVL